MDPSVVKFEGVFYVIFDQLGDSLRLIEKSKWDKQTTETLDLIASTDEFIKDIQNTLSK